MESDPQFYTLFGRCPSLFQSFVGFETSANYRFGSRKGAEGAKNQAFVRKPPPKPSCHRAFV